MKRPLAFACILCLLVTCPIWAQQPGAGEGDSTEAAATTTRDRAIEVLVEASVSKSTQLRSNAIEAMMVAPEHSLPLTTRGLEDSNPGVRFAAVVAAGMKKFKSLAPVIRTLIEDSNPSVRAAALYALRAMGEPVDITPLARMLAGPDPKLRSNVALLLGLMGDESAVPMLQRAATIPMPRAGAAETALVRIQIAEAIGRLGSDVALDALRAGAFSNFGEVRVLSVTAMGAIGDRRMEVMLEHLLKDPPMELQLAAAGALARLGNSRGLDLALKLAGHEQPVIRSQAAWVLGWFREKPAFQRLERMLADSSQMVRVAAAGAVLRRSGGG